MITHPYLRNYYTDVSVAIVLAVPVCVPMFSLNCGQRWFIAPIVDWCQGKNIVMYIEIIRKNSILKHHTVGLKINNLFFEQVQM